MKNLLVGNGFNLEIDRNKSLSNRNIMIRLLKNCRNKDYSSIIKEVTGSDLEMLFHEYAKLLPKILDGKFDTYAQSEDEKVTLSRIKQCYKRGTSVYDIGMEDYFFIMTLESKSHQDNEIIRKGARDGMQWLFLDAIYNDGETQLLANRMKKKKRRLIKEKLIPYDNIFTVNYDDNLEKISEKKVYYLHGNFNHLLDQYTPGTVHSYVESSKGNKVSVPDKWRHIYCNAIMGFSGPDKEKIQNIFNNYSYAINDLKENIKAGVITCREDIIPYCKGQSEDQIVDIVRSIEAVKEHSGQVWNYYPSDVFRSIKGDLEIVGLSPNNDDHIWRAIYENNGLNSVIYYYHDQNDKRNAKTLYGDQMECLPDVNFWN